MESSTSGGSAGQSRGGWRRDADTTDLSVAVADPPPSMTAAHWANRDNDTLYRRPGQTGTFRRPPAEHSFPEESSSARGSQPRAQPGAYPAAGYVVAGGDSADELEAQPARHWTTIGTETRRPRTSDRDEVSTPVANPAANPASRSGPGESAVAPVMRPPSSFGAGASRPPVARRPVAVPGGLAAGEAPYAPSPTSGGAPALSTGIVGSAAVTAPHSRGADPRGADPRGADPRGADPRGADPRGADPRAAGPRGAGPRAAGHRGAAPTPAGAARGSHGVPVGQPMEMAGLLGGPIRDIRPHRANRDGGVAGAPRDDAGRAGTKDGPRRRRSRAILWTVLVLSILTVLGGSVAAVAAFSGSPKGLAKIMRSNVGGPPAESRSVSAPLQDRTQATFEIVTGTTAVTLRSEDLGNDLYRITSAPDSATTPHPVMDGDRVQLHLTPNGSGTGGNVEVLLSAKVRWALRFTGGADEQKVDMSRGQLTGVDIVGGARRFELGLPPAAGTVGIRLSGAVDEFVVTAPKASPVRIRVDSGAKTVAAGDRTLRDVEPGSTLTPKGWQVDNRYDVDAAAKVTLLSVENGG